MLGALASAAWKRPWASLGVPVVALAVLALAAYGADDRLGHPAGASTEAGSVVVVTAPKGRVSAQAYDVTLEAITAGLEALPGIGAVTVIEPPGGDGTARLDVDVSGTGAPEQRRIAERLTDQIDPGPLTVTVEGRLAELLDAEERALDGLWRLELLVVPLAILVLGAGLGIRVAAGPLLCAAIAVAAGLAGLGLLGLLADLSRLGAVAAIGVGVGLGIELPALLVARWEDEVRLDEPSVALRNTLVDGVGTLCFSALLAALAGAAIIAAFARDAFEPGLAAALAVSLTAASAVVASLLVMPPLLALDGRRDVAEGTTRRDQRLAGAVGALPRILARGTARAGLGLVVAVGACLALGVGALDAQTEPLAEAARRPLTDQLPIVAAVAALALAVALAVRARTWRAAPFAAFPLLPLAAALGLATLVFNDGASAFGLTIDEARIPATGAIATALVIVGAIAAARMAAALDSTRFERELDPGAPGVAERAAQLTIPGALFSTVVCGAAFAVLAGAELHAAQELGVVVAAGLIVDLLLRAPVLAALARWGSPVGPRGQRRIRWPRWRKRPQTDPPAASPS